MRESWDRRIRRSDQLVNAAGPSVSLLTFYARLLRCQKAVYDAFDHQPPSGSLDRDMALVRRAALPLLHAVAANGPDQLAQEARRLVTSVTSDARHDAELDDLLLAYWQVPAGSPQFFPKAILQPYAEWLAHAGLAPIDRSVVSGADNRCPCCGGLPQLSILEPVTASLLDGGGRRLLCATCLGTWAFRRVRCAHCGEEDEHTLGYFHAPELDHLRVDVCESCRHYLKTVDLTRLGLAVPLVDEVAGAPLDAWARDRGYEKIELNLVGL